MEQTFRGENNVKTNNLKIGNQGGILLSKSKIQCISLQVGHEFLFTTSGNDTTRLMIISLSEIFIRNLICIKWDDIIGSHGGIESALKFSSDVISVVGCVFFFRIQITWLLHYLIQWYLPYSIRKWIRWK